MRGALLWFGRCGLRGCNVNTLMVSTQRVRLRGRWRVMVFVSTQRRKFKEVVRLRCENDESG